MKARPGERFAPGCDEATILIEQVNEQTGTLTVRPKGSRRTYTRSLEQIVRTVIQGVSMELAGVDGRPSRRRR